MKTGERIGILAKEKGMNLRKLALSANIPYNTLYAMVKRKSERIAPDTLQRIADALQVPVHVLYGEDEAIDTSIDVINEIAILIASINIIKESDDTPQHISELLSKMTPMIDKITPQLMNLSMLAKCGASYSDYISKYKELLEILDTLNEFGYNKALERVGELAEIPKYTIQISEDDN